eukprot:3183054-Rhodomonas_salina.4
MKGVGYWQKLKLFWQAPITLFLAGAMRPLSHLASHLAAARRKGPHPLCCTSFVRLVCRRDAENLHRDFVHVVAVRDPGPSEGRSFLPFQGNQPRVWSVPNSNPDA